MLFCITLSILTASEQDAMQICFNIQESSHTKVLSTCRKQAKIRKFFGENTYESQHTMVITKASESTVSSSTDAWNWNLPSLKTPSSHDDDAVFYELDPSELLKHLLLTTNNNCATAKGDSQCTVNQPSASSKNPTVFAVESSPDTINTTSQHQVADYAHPLRSGPVESASNVTENGSMQCGENVCDYRERFEHFDCASSDFDELPRELLENEAMEFVLLEAQRSLCEESPPSGTRSKCWEFTELRTVETRKDLEGFCDTGDAEEGKNERSDQETVKSDCDSVTGREGDDVDDAMVLVPAGKSLNFDLSSYFLWNVSIASHFYPDCSKEIH